MKIRILQELTDRQGNFIGKSLGQTIIEIIDTTSVAGIKAAGNPRLLARVAERIDNVIVSKSADIIELNGEEEKALRMLVNSAVNLAYFYHRRIMAMLWPDELEEDERRVLLGENQPRGNGGTSKEGAKPN